MNCLVVANGVIYAGGAFTNIGSANRSRVAALDPVTALATTWAPSASADVNAIAPYGVDVHMAGRFSDLNGIARARIGAVNASTGTTSLWSPGASGTVNALLCVNGNVYAGGTFSGMSGGPAGGLAAIIGSGVLAVPAPFVRAGGLELARIAPNPTHGAARVDFVLSVAARARLTVYDVTGRRVAQVFDGALAAGAHSLEWSASQARLRAGLYLMRLDVDGVQRTRRFVYIE